MQMAIGRGGDPSKNFAVGEPRMLGAAISRIVNPPRSEREFDPTYPAAAGDPRLRELIAASPWQNGRHIVIANGAKQALAAAFYALKKTGAFGIHVPTPFWPSFPTLIESAGLYGTFGPYPVHGHALCWASPNNPDGQQWCSNGKLDVWDAAYASPAYGWNELVPPARMTVHSGSKLFGLSGLRVGWLSTDDQTLADHATRFVEITTSGVSNASQRFLMEAVSMHPDQLREVHGRSRRLVLENAAQAERILGPVCESVQIPCGPRAGMFAWVKPKDYQEFMESVKRGDLKVVTGDACGMRGWVRFTLGNDPTETYNAFAAAAGR